jgi:preprotein translocase subunit SecD
LALVRKILLFLAVAAVASLVWKLIAPRLHLVRWLHGSALVFRVEVARARHPSLGRDAILRRELDTVRERAIHLSGLAETRLDGERLIVELPGKYLEAARRFLPLSAELVFEIVDDGSDFMKRAAERADLVALVEIGHDQWTAKDLETHSDVYFRSPKLSSILAVRERLAGEMPADHALLYEAIPEYGWRTYYVFKRAEIESEDIDDVDVSWDASSGRPEVSVHFNDPAGKRFAELTARSVGRKLAIVLNGRVSSAPVIETRIDGGRARITLGGTGDPMQIQDEAKDLVAVLRTGALEAPLELVDENKL